jgi:hypothetical protein
VKNTVFGEITPSSPVEVQQQFEGKNASVFRVDEYAKRETSRKLCLPPLSACFLRNLFFDPEDGVSTFLRNVRLFKKTVLPSP